MQTQTVTSEKTKRKNNFYTKFKLKSHSNILFFLDMTTWQRCSKDRFLLNQLSTIQKSHTEFWCHFFSPALGFYYTQAFMNISLVREKY